MSEAGLKSMIWGAWRLLPRVKLTENGHIRLSASSKETVADQFKDDAIVTFIEESLKK